MMINVEYEVDKSVPPDKELIMFDRNAFQCLQHDVFTEISKRYNILCPIHFVIECISPNNSDNKDLVTFDKEKRALLRKLELIENPIVFTGSTNIVRRISPPSNVKDFKYTDILASWQIARNCIINSPVTMKCISPNELVSRCNPNIWYVKHENRETTETIDANKGDFSPRQYRSLIQRRDKLLHNISRDLLEIRRELRSNPTTNITTELSNVCGHVLREFTDDPKDEIIENSKVHFGLNDEDIESLSKIINSNKILTIENYPCISYPIYIYFLNRYMCYGRHQNADHLDDSFFFDFQYLHYLNFCDKFIADETSTPHIVQALPFNEIKNKLIKSEEFIKELL